MAAANAGSSASSWRPFRPLRSSSRVDECAASDGAFRRHHPGRMTWRPARNPITAFDRQRYRAEPGLTGPVMVEGVRDIGQRHPPRRGPVILPAPPPSQLPACGLLSADACGTAAAAPFPQRPSDRACSIDHVCIQPLTPNDDTPAQADRWLASQYHRRRSSAEMRPTWPWCQLVEVKMPRNSRCVPRARLSARAIRPPLQVTEIGLHRSNHQLIRNPPGKTLLSERVRSMPMEHRPRRSRYRPLNFDDVNAWASNACCAGPLGTVTPPPAPSWLTAEPRTTARMRLPSCANASSSRRVITLHRGTLAAHHPSADASKVLHRPSG